MPQSLLSPISRLRRWPANPWRALLVTGALGVLVAAPFRPGWAQSGPAQADKSESRGRVLHEYFDPWSVEISGAAQAASPGGQDDASNERSAAAKAGQPPGLSLSPDTDEVIFGEDGPVDPGRTSTPWGPLEPGASVTRLDNATDRVDQLKYWANFEPSVVPYKRVVVQNAVAVADGAYTLELNTGAYRKVAIENGAPRADEDLFWGSFLLRVEAGKRHPIPSIAPQQRILSVQVAPRATVEFVRDRADNFYLIPDADGLLRINMRLAVPRAYFSAPFGPQTAWRQFSNIPERRDARLAPAAERVARDVLKMVGVTPQMSPRDALLALVEYYRDFEARPFPDALQGEDLYTSISREQVGVCRHRSLAFVISARALGIPTRYVYNEAHAFVEVFWPGVGWRRIDLGGAADEVDYSGRSDGPVHQVEDDPLPKPPNYMSELERIAGSVPGAEGPGASSPQDLAGSEQAEQAEQAEQGENISGADSSEARDMPPQSGPVEQFDPSGQLASPAPRDTRKPVRIDAVSTASDVFLGSEIGLSGSLFTRAGRPVSRAEIQVYLGPPGVESTEGLRLLGTLETDGGGRFEGEFIIPENMPIGRWIMILRYEGDKTYQPAQVN